MAYERIEDIPQDVRSKLGDEYIQKVYMTAYNSVAGSGNEEAAKNIAWQTIERTETFFKDDNGCYHTRTQWEGVQSAAGHGAIPNASNS